MGNDKRVLDLDVPFDSDLSWDISDQSTLNLDEFTIAGNPDALALTCVLKMARQRTNRESVRQLFAHRMADHMIIEI